MTDEPESGTVRVALGEISSGLWGLRTSLPGYSALTTTDERYLSFDSTWLDLLQIHESGEATCSSTPTIVISGRGTYYRLCTFASPGFVPVVMLWIVDYGAYKDYPAGGGLDTLVVDGAIYLRSNTGSPPAYTWSYVVTKIPIMEAS